MQAVASLQISARSVIIVSETFIDSLSDSDEGVGEGRALSDVFGGRRPSA